MNLFDSHVHLDDERFDDDREMVIKSLPSRGITQVMNSGASLSSSRKGIELAEQYDFIYAAVGIHPHDAAGINDAMLDELQQLAGHKKVRAIGEIGLDYYYDNSPRESQKEWFEKQLQMAIHLNMPVILHDRDAHGDILNILKKYKGRMTGVMHCYSGSTEMAKEILELGLVISLGGVITFKNAKKAHEAAQAIPLNKLLIETDCPYLTPEPHRGKRNDPGYVRLVAEKLAEIKGIPVEEVAEQTCKNAMELFNIE